MKNQDAAKYLITVPVTLPLKQTAETTHLVAIAIV